MGCRTAPGQAQGFDQTVTSVINQGAWLLLKRIASSDRAVELSHLSRFPPRSLPLLPVFYLVSAHVYFTVPGFSSASLPHWTTSSRRGERMCFVH